MAMDLSKSKNAGRMKAIQEKSKEQGNGTVTINIPLDQIDENPDNEKTFNMEKVDAIARSIEQIGFFGTISVFKKPDGRYEISSGHTRYRAMKKIGNDTIPCSVSPYPDEFKRGLILLSSNTNNRVMSPMDWARAIDYYYNLMRSASKGLPKGEKAYTGKLRNSAAEFFDMSPTNIERYHSLLNLIPDLQDMANNPEFPYSAFTTAGTMSKDDQELLHEKIMDELENNKKRSESGEAIAGISRTRIEQIINGIKHKPDNTAQQDKSYGGFITNAIKPHSENNEEFREVTGNVSVPDEFINPPVNDNDKSDENEDVVETYEESDNDSFVDNAFVDRSYSQEEDISKDSYSGSMSVEKKLSSFTPEIEKIASGMYEIADPDMVKRYLKRLKSAIEKIENRL